MKSPLEKAEAKHKENVIRLQTHAIFEGVKVDEEMIIRLKQACIKFFEEHPLASGVPKEVLMSVLPSRTVEMAQKPVLAVSEAF